MGLLGKLRRSPDPGAELREALGDFELPGFPEAALKGMSLLREPDASLHDVAVALELDPRLHVGLLATVNSAAFGLRRQVEQLEQAVTLLGPARVESVVVAVALSQARPKVGGWFDDHAFSAHAARRAAVARALASQWEPAEAGNALGLGLMADMGVPLLARAHADRYRSLWEGGGHGLGLSELDGVESDDLGHGHRHVGRLLLEHWKLPGALLDAKARWQEEGRAPLLSVELTANLPRGEEASWGEILREHPELPAGTDPGELAARVEAGLAEASAFLAA